MSFDLSAVHASRGFPGLPARHTPAAAPAGSFARALGHATRRDSVDTIPASPPPELRDEMFAAQRAIEDLRARGRELHFEMIDGRLRIEMRDLEGHVSREIPPNEALAIASGKTAG
jgi:hypothetical protein